jgi:hypothetical protein
MQVAGVGVEPPILCKRGVRFSFRSAVILAVTQPHPRHLVSEDPLSGYGL